MTQLYKALADETRLRLVQLLAKHSPDHTHLTGTEFALLAELAHRMDAIVTPTELLSGVWMPEYRGSNYYLHTYIGRLRKKLGEYSDLLETVPGMGHNLRSKKID